MKDPTVIYDYEGTRSPRPWLVMKCIFLYREHFYMSPNPQRVQSWCGRCGKLDPEFVHTVAPKTPEIKPMVIPLHTLEVLLSEQDMFHFIPNSKLPPHAPAKKELNKSIKGNVVWLVDEYKTRKKIPAHVTLDQHQLDEFIGGIVDLVQMYEGTYRLPGEPEPEEEDDDFGTKV